jgi:5,10-methylene-tetrahydrofolate dehydrogenase/methenyl tetrahydrofolate cyclohydrolase
VLKRTGTAQNSDFEEGEGVEETIIEANEDADVDGIMVLDSNVYDKLS